MEAQLAPGAKPAAEVQWLKDGQQLQKTDEHFKQSEEANGVHKLTIIRVAQADKGRITLQAQNKFGTAGEIWGREGGGGRPKVTVQNETSVNAKGTNWTN